MMKPPYNLATESARLRAANAELRKLRDGNPVEFRRFMAALREGRPFLTKALRDDIRRLWQGFAPDQSPSVSH
jgi:hypothetical protein